FGIVQAFWRSFVPRPDDGAFFAERMTVRLSAQAPINDPRSFYRPVVKVAHRADPEVQVGRGNHDLIDSPLRPLPSWYPIEVLHFPLRSRAQWRRKVELQGEAFTRHIGRTGTGYHRASYGARKSARIVGIVLVRNEDMFVERAIRNVAAFCDRIHVVDHVSTDGTWEILQALASEYDHLDARRAGHAGVSHTLVEPYAGTATWVFG